MKPWIFCPSLAVTVFYIAVKVLTGTTKMVVYSHLSFTPPALQESKNQS